MRESDLSQGQDSFLDIIANLVGVLIILVVVVGAQASSAMVSQSQEAPVVDRTEELVGLQLELAKTKSKITTLRYDNEELERRVDRESQMAIQLGARRHQMLVKLQRVRSALDEKIAQSDDQQQRHAKQRAKEIELVSQLEAVNAEINAVSVTQIETVVETIDHYPNPIAKTVFTEEAHFRLSEGRLAWVPMDELIGRMRSEARLKAEKLRSARGTTETVGPIDGFWLRYELEAVPASRPGANDRSVRLRRFVVQPADPTIGEDVEFAMDERSEFSRRLATMKPGRTTISVWVYPDSYDKYSTLRDWIQKQGFQMASWPLSEGRPISGGPNGLRTSAQ